MTIRTLARGPMAPEGAPPCHGLSDLFNGSRVDGGLLPDLLACCDRCHITRQCAQMALQIEVAATSSVSGVWGGVFITSPSQPSGPLHEARLQALAQLQAVAGQSMAAAR